MEMEPDHQQPTGMDLWKSMRMELPERRAQDQAKDSHPDFGFGSTLFPHGERIIPSLWIMGERLPTPRVHVGRR
jgi:hypothetical protein